MFLTKVKPIYLRNEKDHLVTDYNNLGDKIEEILPCLKGDIELTEQFDLELQSQRFLRPEKLI